MTTLTYYRKLAPLLIILLCFASSCNRHKSHSVAGIDAVEEILMVEDHSEVLLEWLKRGDRGMVVVNIDLHDDLRLVPDWKISELKKLVARKRWDDISARRERGAESLFTLGDYLYPAYRLGIIKRLYWVSTSPLLEESDIESAGKRLLSGLGYPDSVVSTFRREGNTIRGIMYGLDVTISSLRNIPVIGEPVLLTIDADYFAGDLKRTGNSGLMILGDFFRNLRRRHIQVGHASIAYSVLGNYTEITERHLGDEAAYVLSHPEILAQGFPPMWKKRDTAFSLLRSGRYAESIEAFAAGEAAFPHELSFRLGRSIALALIGQDGEALRRLEELSRLEPQYDYAYLSIGNMLMKGQDPRKAQKYYREYLKGHPNSFHGLMAYGEFLYNQGFFEEALEYYQKVVEQFLEVSAVMYCGDALMHLKRLPEAKMYYTKGLELLRTVGYKSLKDFPQSSRYIRILNIYLNNESVLTGRRILQDLCEST